MKKIISLVLVCVLLVGCMFTLASCSTILMGKYEAKGLFGATTLEFNLDGTMTYTKGSISLNGTYEIEKDDSGNYEIEFDFGEEDKDTLADLFDGDHSFSKGTEDGVDFVKIGGVRYNKVK